MDTYHFSAFIDGAPLGMVEVERTIREGQIPPWHGFAKFLDTPHDDPRLQREAELTLLEGYSECRAWIASNANGVIQLTVLRADR